MGKGNNEAAALLFEKYGKKISFALCGPVGEYLGLMAGIAFADTDGRPSRLAARGGVGAVMGSKKVKAIVVDVHKMPTFHDRKKVMGAIREYGARLGKEPAIDIFKRIGTAMMGDITNRIGGLPVRNFSAGRLVEASEGPLKLGGDYIRELNSEPRRADLARLHAGLHDRMQQRLRRRERQGARVAAGIRDPRPDGQQLRPRRTRTTWRG